MSPTSNRSVEVIDLKEVSRGHGPETSQWRSQTENRSVEVTNLEQVSRGHKP